MMQTPHHDASAAVLRRASRFCALGVVLLGVAVLFGWILDFKALQTILPGVPAMSIPTACSLVTAGFSLWLLRQQDSPVAKPDFSLQTRLALCLAIVTALIGCIAIGYQVSPGAAVASARAGSILGLIAGTSPASALGQILTGAALIAYSRRRYLIGQACALTALGIAGIGVLSYLYRVTALSEVWIYARMSPHSAVGHTALAFGILASRPDRGFVSLITAANPGGDTVRKLLPAAILAPALLGWMRLAGEHRGLYGTEFGLALMVSTLTILLVTLILRSGALLGATDAARCKALNTLEDREAMLRMLLNCGALGTYSIDAAGRCTFANPALLRMLGYRSAEPLLGRRIHELMHHTRADGTPYPDAECRIYQAFRQNEEMHVDDELFWRADGTGVPIEYWSYPIRNGREAIGAVVTVLDLTQRKAAEAAARANEELFSKAFRSSPLAISVSTLKDGRFIEVNDAFVNIFGYAREHVIGKTSVELGLWYDANDRSRLVETLLRQGSFQDLESRFRRCSGSSGYTLTAAEQIEFRGEPCVLALFADITERKNAESRVRRLNRTYAMLSSTNAVIIRSDDRAKLFEAICRIAIDKGGFRLAAIGAYRPDSEIYELQAWAGHNDGYLEHVQSLSTWNDKDAPIAGRLAATEGRAVIVNDVGAPDAPLPAATEALARGFRSLAILPLLIAGKTAGLLHLYASEPDFFDPDELKLLHEMASDVAFAMQHISQQERLEYLAYYDALTGLPNRSLFRERLRQFVQSAHRGGSQLALVLLNIERFREINDSLGPRVGDQLLTSIAKRLSAMMPEPDKLARIGGDMFAAVFPGVGDASEVLQMVQRHLLAAFREPFRHDDWELRVGARAGIALFPFDGSDADSLFRNAEAAMRNAKHSVEHHRFYSQEMNRWTTEKLSLEHQLHRAVENREFSLVYQPKFGTRTAHITGLEALLRWYSPERGLVMPGEFIPLLEETGLIIDVGRWVMERAVIDYRRWLAAGLAVPRIAVNVSALQLRDPDFVDNVEQAIRAGGAPIVLDLELTESLLLEDLSLSHSKLARLRMAGMRISMDDFGSGYSSLKYLSSLPVDNLKIDRDFTSRITAGAEHRDIVGAIISMAHTLHLPVIAEGVETDDQLRVLQELGCDEAQGYLFCRPQPAATIEELLRKQ